MVNFREVKELIQLMNDNDLSEIEVEHEGSKIKLKKGADGLVMQEPLLRAAQPVAQQPAPADESKEVPSNAQAIKSPMVGTFYAAPSPDAEPYLKVGSKVEVGQVVCIVEAMKLMNEIKSEIKGTVTEIHSQNGSPVEFGQPLFSLTT